MCLRYLCVCFQYCPCHLFGSSPFNFLTFPHRVTVISIPLRTKHTQDNRLLQLFVLGYIISTVINSFPRFDKLAAERNRREQLQLCVYIMYTSLHSIYTCRCLFVALVALGHLNYIFAVKLSMSINCIL